MSTQRALFIESKQGPFVVGERDIPTPPKDEVLLKVLATALNPVDWKVRAYGFFVQSYPAIIGTDIAGEIDSVGEGVEGWKKGDKVFTQGYFSNARASYQQYTLVPTDFLIKIPDNVTVDQAATIPVAFMAGCFGLFGDAPIGIGLNPTFSWDLKYPGQTAVVIGGSTSVGQYAIQLLKFLGFSRIIAHASSKHAAHIKSLGASDVLDRVESPIASLASAIHAITSDPIKTVFDATGFPDSQQAAYDILAEGGKGVTVGAVKPDMNKPEDKKKVVGVVATVHAQPAFGKLVMQNLGKLVAAGIILPNRFEIVPGGLEGIIVGLERLKSNLVSGQKLVVHPQESQ